MVRRMLVPWLGAGRVVLPADQAHHARDVLRLQVGVEVELFTAAGHVGAGVLVEVSPTNVVAEVKEVRLVGGDMALTIASAVPKGARADWMIEKLSELGVSRFVPLMTERSVVHPEGRNKIERWERLAAEAAKQSRRVGVMRVEGLVPVEEFIGRERGRVAYLSTAPGSVSIQSMLEIGAVMPVGIAEANPTRGGPETALALLVGPEGGWSEGEAARLSERGLTAVTLGATILRVETAAIAAAAVVAALRAG